MSWIQIIAIALGALFIASNFIDFKKLLNQNTVKENLANSDEVIELDNSTKKDSLSDIVSSWEKLKNICKQNNLSEAEKKLEEIFPLLVKKDKPDEPAV
jgi:hypothetical protein